MRVPQANGQSAALSNLGRTGRRQGGLKQALLTSAFVVGLVGAGSRALAQPAAPALPPSADLPVGGAAPAPGAQGVAVAAQSEPPAFSVGEVVVTGDAYANAKTIVAKRSLGVVSDGISANQIGELPEFGLGDAISSVPGVSFIINNGRGEDQFLTIRGLNPYYDSVTVD